VLHPRHARQQLLLQRWIFEDAKGDHQQVPLPADGPRVANRRWRKPAGGGRKEAGERRISTSFL
jgi:hypothetical protein